jgi:hypothetical protein
MYRKPKLRYEIPTAGTKKPLLFLRGIYDCSPNTSSNEVLHLQSGFQQLLHKQGRENKITPDGI